MAKDPRLRLGRFITLQEPSDASVDIIAICGLGTCNRKTWFSTLLPRDIPSARVLLWSYDENPFVSLEALNSHAQELLSELAGSTSWRLVVSRPIIFVAHSLGGLLLKQALILAQESGVQIWKNILDSTKAVVFLGTPFALSRKASYKHKSEVSATRKVDKDQVVVQSESINNEPKTSPQSFWHKQQLKFDHIWRTGSDFKIIAFTEVGSTPEHTAIASKDGMLFSSRYTQIPLQRDHSDLWFSRTLDTSYKLLAAEFQKLIIYDFGTKEHTPLRLRSKPHSLGLASSKIQHYLATLKPGDGSASVAAPAPGTLSWIVENSKFKSWINYKADGWLWIKGKPGCGKSTLAKFLVERTDDSSHENRITLSYFFDHSSSGQSGVLGFFRTTLYQLVDKIGCSRCVQQLESILIEVQGTSVSSNWQENPDVLAQHLRRVLSMTAKAHNIFFIVDGLDVCDQKSAAIIVDFLRSETREASSNGLRVCTTSRYSAHTEKDELEVYVDSENSDDILSYISLQARNCKRKCPHQLAQELSQKILMKADGVFLWVRLALSQLNEAFEVGKDLLEVLYGLPNNLQEFYERLLKQINRENVTTGVSVHEIMRLILVTMRPLSIKELYALASITISRSTSICRGIQFDAHQVRFQESLVLSFGERLRSRCAGLLCIGTNDAPPISGQPGKIFDIGSQVHFVHYTVREYLEKKCFDATSDIVLETLRIRSLPHLDMAERLLNILNLGVLYLDTPHVREKSSDLPISFLQYAITYWSQHIGFAEEAELEPKYFDSFWHKLIQLQSYPWSLIQKAIPEAFPEWCSADSTNLLHVCCHFGWRHSIKVILSDCHQNDMLNVQLNGRDGRGRTPLCLAAEEGRSEIVRILLNAGADFDTLDSHRGFSPLHCASFAGHHEIVEVLINAGAAVNDARSGSTPLTHSAAKGYIDCVRILLENGADPCPSDRLRGQTALSLAILNQDIEMVKLLLEHGADINTKDIYSEYVPVHHALMSRSPDILNILCASGTCIIPRSTRTKVSKLDMWLERLSRILPSSVLQQPVSTRSCCDKPSKKCTKPPRLADQSASISKPENGGRWPKNVTHDHKRSRDDSDDKKPNVKRSKPDGGTAPRYACPFFKYDRQGHHNCGFTGYLTMNRMKDHLKLRHFIHRCTRCGVVAGSKEDLIIHKRAEPGCSYDPDDERDFSAGYDEDQAEDIKQRDRGQSNEAKWTRIYKALFPHIEDGQIPDPYFEPLLSAPDQSFQFLQDYNNNIDQRRRSVPFIAGLRSLLERRGSAEEVLSLFETRDAQTRMDFLERQRLPVEQPADIEDFNSGVERIQEAHSQTEDASYPSTYFPLRIDADQIQARDTGYYETNHVPLPTVDSGIDEFTWPSEWEGLGHTQFDGPGLDNPISPVLQNEYALSVPTQQATTSEHRRYRCTCRTTQYGRHEYWCNSNLTTESSRQR